jgi:hypothetical protein
MTDSNPKEGMSVELRLADINASVYNILEYRLAGHKSNGDIRVDLIITNLNTLVWICCRIQSNESSD